ncbi:DUF3119 family protein [Prochlorococcus sp. MIT 1223]|uniref:DUF3119 family protein n=1 Tax=Prochlorococcus sp. MIT 1223 TaxID=3096217 RepID=UPI002A74BD74|nr:DUF3119 family protein [Prochlorococcus sp. MIT 1223]
MNQELQLNSNEEIILSSSFKLPLIITGFGAILLVLPFSPLPTILISSFGLFLLLQSFTLKLKFTKEDLVVLQLGKELRRFPFKNWLAWKLIFPTIPGFFYFREEASPHLLPILFNPKELEAQLKLRVGELEIKKS